LDDTPAASGPFRKSPRTPLESTPVVRGIDRLAELEAQRAQCAALKERFGLAQLARYQRFLSILNAARGMFREDKAATAELERFKRPRGRPRKADEAEAT
jgi:hypothetical protein